MQVNKLIGKNFWQIKVVFNVFWKKNALVALYQGFPPWGFVICCFKISTLKFNCLTKSNYTWNSNYAEVCSAIAQFILTAEASFLFVQLYISFSLWKETKSDFTISNETKYFLESVLEISGFWSWDEGSILFVFLMIQLKHNVWVTEDVLLGKCPKVKHTDQIFGGFHYCVRHVNIV